MSTRTSSLPDLNAHAFFAANPFFRRDEFVGAYATNGRSTDAARNALAYHVRTRTLLSIRQGVYMVCEAPFDALLLPSKLHPRAVLAYDGAAAFHQLVGLEHTLCFLAPRAMPRFHLSEIIFRAIADPTVSAPENNLDTVRSLSHRGHTLRVTSLERTLVDCLDRIDLGPDVELLFSRFLDRDLHLDLDQLLVYAARRASGLGCARLGLLLSSHPHYENAGHTLAELAERVPRGTHHLCRQREYGTLYFRRWHLVAPRPLADRLSNQ